LKKLLTLLFTFALAFSLAMPVFAQEAAGGQDAPKSEKKEKKMKKEKKSKKEKKEKKSDEAPKQ